MDLSIPDQFKPLYEFERSTNPDFSYDLRPINKTFVRAVDILLEKTGNRNFVRTEQDWEAMEEVFRFYWKRWPGDAKEFSEIIPDIRKMSAPGGYSKSKEIKYVGAVPPLLMKLIKIIFPDQQWDKKFSNTFVKRYKMFNVGGRT